MADVLLIVFPCHVSLGEEGAKRRLVRKMLLPVFPHLKQPVPRVRVLPSLWW
jgi:hypothetical protein